MFNRAHEIGYGRDTTMLRTDKIMQSNVLKLGHSPDSDDAFMFYALAKGLIDTGGLQFEHILRDIQTLNEWALEKRLEITAVSFYAYTKIFRDYVILESGASVGDKYGPMIVTAAPKSINELRKMRIAIPGLLTTAFLTAQLALGKFDYVIMPFNKILEALAAGQIDAGLIIHEGQLTYGAYKLHCSLDLGKWWFDQTAMPLPLGCNVVRRDLASQRIAAISRILKASINYALAHRDEALSYALEFTPHLERKLGDKFVGMYVNDLTVDLGERGKAAVRQLLRQSAKAGLSEWPIDKTPDFI